MEYTLINPINEKYSALEQVLTNRGINIEDIPHYLSLTKQDNLSPALLKNIDKAVYLLLRHIQREDSHIHIQVDADCDGYTSSAYLMNYIHAVFPSAIQKITYSLHTGKQHGIDLAAVPAYTTLVIAPDASSNEYEIHEHLVQQGIDVLVIDHHQAEKESEYACVVNNQLCDYPNKTLSGVGVVYKVCQKLDELLKESHADDFIDLVACGLVGDMMDLRNMETRYLIQEGLHFSRNPFLKAMIERQSYQLKDEVTPIGMAFYIVPFINAMTRSGTQEEKELLFESMLEWKAYDLVPSTKRGCKGQEETRVEQAVRTCTNVKNRQTKVQDAAVETIEKMIKEQNLLDNKLLIVRLPDSSVPAEVRGLIANKLMSKYQRPVAIVSKTEQDGKILWAGSARGYDKSSMKDFRQFCQDSNLVELAQGHANAFGLTLQNEKFDDFIAYSNEALKDLDFTPSYLVDFVFHAQDVNRDVILDLGEHKELWGQNMEEPMLAVEKLNVTKDMLTLMSRDKNPTLKIELSNGVSCIKFKSSEEEYNSLYSDQGCVTINLVGRPEVNRYFSSVTPQILISDYEVINKQDFYF